MSQGAAPPASSLPGRKLEIQMLADRTLGKRTCQMTVQTGIALWPPAHDIDNESARNAPCPAFAGAHDARRQDALYTMLNS